jgi:hypothetical protein
MKMSMPVFCEKKKGYEDLWVDNNVSEENTAPIFRADEGWKIRVVFRSA